MKQTGRYILILVGVMILWNSFVIWPLKIFTVVLHELGHALMAVIFGHGIQGIEVYFNESGHTIVKSGGWLSDFFITNGGYLGSLVFALIILKLKNTPLKKFILGGTAIIFLAVSIKYSKFMSSLFIFSIGFAAVVIILYMLQKEVINDWVIDIIGIASVAYAVYDT
ncbi:MAG TPA: M50 family metallopeptidase, partial [Clostridia bacterium]